MDPYAANNAYKRKRKADRKKNEAIRARRHAKDTEKKSETLMQRVVHLSTAATVGADPEDAAYAAEEKRRVEKLKDEAESLRQEAKRLEEEQRQLEEESSKLEEKAL